MLSASFAHGKATDHTQPRTVLAQVRSAMWNGHILTGYVRRATLKGVVVMLDVVEGFVHVSEVAEPFKHKTRTDLAKLPRPGTQVKVRVLSVSENGRHISLSMRQAHAA